MSTKWSRGDVLALLSLILGIFAFAQPEVRRCVGLEPGGCLLLGEDSSPVSTDPSPKLSDSPVASDPSPNIIISSPISSDSIDNTTPTSPSLLPSPTGLRQAEIGANYSELQALLSAENFKEADLETTRLINLYPSASSNYPCNHIKTIDQLWLQHSNGKFGFSIQNQIWKEASQEWWFSYLGDRVGWLKQGIRSYNDVSFNLSAPVGHLPYSIWHGGYGWINNGPRVLARCL